MHKSPEQEVVGPASQKPAVGFQYGFAELIAAQVVQDVPFHAGLDGSAAAHDTHAEPFQYGFVGSAIAHVVQTPCRSSQTGVALFAAAQVVQVAPFHAGSAVLSVSQDMQTPESNTG